MGLVHGFIAAVGRVTILALQGATQENTEELVKMGEQETFGHLSVNHDGHDEI